MDLILSECRALHPVLKLTARLKHFSKALTLPEDAPAYLLEIAKFLATAALILATGVALLMLG